MTEDRLNYLRRQRDTGRLTPSERIELITALDQMLYDMQAREVTRRRVADDLEDRGLPVAPNKRLRN